jgi:menaquinone-dependent protoporphyrinogen IX oxidase
MQFVQSHQAALAQKPLAIFVVYMTLAAPNAAKCRQEVAGWLKPVRTQVRPVSEGFFAGAFDITQMPSFADKLKLRLGVAMNVWPEGDYMDWQAIQSWAESLGPLLLR